MVTSPTSDDPQWEDVGTVEKLYLYPLKSCAPNSLQKAKVGKFGLIDGALRDRAFMVVDRKNRFITGRQQPKLVLIKVQAVPSTGNIQFFAFGQAGRLVVKIPDTAEPSNVVYTEVHGQPCKGYDLGGPASEWITSYINGGGGSPYRLIYHDFEPDINPVNERKNPMSSKYPAGAILQDDTALFADGFGFLLLTSNSMDDLNARLETKGKGPLDERWFRPNIYVKNKDGHPYDEDNWEFIKISETIFRVPRPCTRCIFTTINPTQGTKDKDMEPLKTLRTYRSAQTKKEKELYGDSPLFGVNLGIDDQMVDSSIQVGERVFIIRRQKQKSHGGREIIKSGLISIILAASVMTLAIVVKRKCLS